MIYTESMSDSKKVKFSSLIFKLPLFVVLLCGLLSCVTGFVGYKVFKTLFEEQYKNITSQIALTALSYIDGDSIPRYVSNPVEDGEWIATNEMLNALTNTTDLAYIYVTVPDENFENRLYLYDTVHPKVMEENPKIKPYPLGKVNSLKKYDEMRLKELRNIIENGTSEIHFVYNSTGGHVTTSIPVKNSYGKNLAILSVVKPMSEVKDFKSRYLRTTFMLSSLITLLALVLFILIVLKGLIKPIVLVTKETSEFAEHKGELTGILSKIKGHSEPAILARAVEKMSVDVATQIQANMLPTIFPPYANCPELELFATMTPAKEVGGDFYDFFMIDKRHFAVVVGDVSGKGVPAALFMVIAKTLIKNEGLRDTDPAKILTQVNNELCEGNDALLFVTCWIGVLDLETLELQFSNAGHTPPILHHNGETKYIDSKKNLMLAVMPSMEFKRETIKLDYGDRLLLYTDGVTEATNANNELYGEERLLSTVRGLQFNSSKEMLDSLRKDVDDFVGDAPQFDDLTMLELSLKKNESPVPKIYRKTFAATDENMESVNDFVHGIIPKDCAKDILNKIDLAVEEIYINIAHYAYTPNVGDVYIECELFEGEKKEIRITFSDSGKEFNPIAKEDPDITLSVEERDIGGLGIYLTKEFMDSVTYEYASGKNILTMRKTLS